MKNIKKVTQKWMRSYQPINAIDLWRNNLQKLLVFFLFTLDSRFQVLKIKLNQAHKVDSFYEDPKRDEIVSVFVSNRVSPFIKPK